MAELKTVASIPKLSKETGISTYTIRRLIKEGRLPVLKMGNKWFVEVEAFKALFVKEGEDHV